MVRFIRKTNPFLYLIQNGLSSKIIKGILIDKG